MSNKSTIEEINKAIHAHGSWKLKLQSAITRGSSDLTPDVVKCDDKCEFGKWLYGPSISPNMRAGVPYQVIKRLHAEFHTCAGSVLEKAVAQRARDARALLGGEFDDRSQVLVVALTKWKRELDTADAA